MSVDGRGRCDKKAENCRFSLASMKYNNIISILYQSNPISFMPYCGSSILKDRPFLLGLTVPADWAPADSPDCRATILMERAVALEFDFLLAPRSLAELYAPADLAACAKTARPFAPPRLSAADNNGIQRDLVWLQQPLMTVTDGVIVSVPDDILHGDHVPELRNLIAAARATGHEDRCVMLEIEIGSASRRYDARDVAAGDEDDMLENFIISLGKTLPKTGLETLCTTVKPVPDPERLRQVLLQLHEIECDGVSFVLPDPLDDIKVVGGSLIRPTHAV
jgi:hypothetical protein